VVRGN